MTVVGAQVDAECVADNVIVVETAWQIDKELLDGDAIIVTVVGDIVLDTVAVRHTETDVEGSAVQVRPSGSVPVPGRQGRQRLAEASGIVSGGQAVQPSLPPADI